MSSNTFIEQWTKDIGIEFQYVEQQEPEEHPLCFFAADFFQWCQNLIDELHSNKVTDISINVALLDLQDTFWSWFTSAPKQHRYHHLNPKNGKKCLFAVYQETYMTLRKLALSITPPRLKEPPKPPPPQTIDRGIFLGEDVGEGLSDLS
jgi:hypothetical protein